MWACVLGGLYPEQGGLISLGLRLKILCVLDRFKTIYTCDSCRITYSEQNLTVSLIWCKAPKSMKTDLSSKKFKWKVLSSFDYYPRVRQVPHESPQPDKDQRRFLGILLIGCLPALVLKIYWSTNQFLYLSDLGYIHHG